MKNSTNKKFKIYFILHLPPPIHGAAMMGEYIKESKIINESFNCTFQNLALAKDIQDIGKGGIIKIYTFFKLITKVIYEILRQKPDLCYITPNAKGGAFYKDFIIVLLLKILRQNIVVHYHNKGISDKQNNFFDDLLYRIFFKNIKVILLTKQLYKDIKKYVNIKNIYYCPNGIPLQKNFSCAYSKNNNNDFNIIFLSNMMIGKGVLDLLYACKILKDRKKTFKCHFIGKWSDINESFFKEKIHKLGLDDFVRTYGAIYGKEKNKFYENANLFVFPTYYHNECFPLVLLEAMEHGLPCISTNEGGIEDIIDNNKTGFIVEKKSPKLLANKIEYCIDNPNICEKMGKEGRKKFLEEYTIKTFENNMKSILNNILQTK